MTYRTGNNKIYYLFGSDSSDAHTKLSWQIVYAEYFGEIK